MSRLLTVCRLLNAAGVRYVIVGGFALALHGAIRATKGVDVLIEPTLDHARRALEALRSLTHGVARELDPAEVIAKPITIIGDDTRVVLLTLAWSVRGAAQEPRMCPPHWAQATSAARSWCREVDQPGAYSRRAAELRTPSAEPTFMGMPDLLTPVYWTADMARRLPEDGNRYEVVYGELLVTPAPRAWHQMLVLRLAAALQAYLERNPGIGIPFVSPADISWGQDVLLQPDVFVVPVEQARALDWSAIRDLLLVAEVLSPSTPRHDRFTKRRRYQEARVPLYWIVDGDARQVEVWTPEDVFPRIERDRLIWRPEGAGIPFTLALQQLFRAIE